MTPPPLALLDLPIEVREIILAHLLSNPGMLETQFPLWGNSSDFIHPVMQVCRSLRAEALATFYRVNKFKFILDVSNPKRIDPVIHPPVVSSDTEHSLPNQSDSRGNHPDVASAVVSPKAPPFFSAIPWEYPNLMSDLRHLTLHLLVPGIGSKADRSSFAPRLERMVRGVDYGRRLKDLHLVIGTGPLGEQEVAMLKVLSEMRIACRAGERSIKRVRLNVLPPSSKPSIELAFPSLKEKVVGMA